MGKTQKSIETRNKLKESAIKLFNQKGFDDTTVRNIVEDANYAKGTFYLYWEAKEDVLLELTNDFLLYFRDLMTTNLTLASDDPLAEVDRLIDQSALLMKAKTLSFKTFHTHEILQILTNKGISIPFIDEIFDPITQYLTACIQKGLIRTVDPVLYCKMLFSISHDLMESAMLYGFPAEVDKVKEELKLIIRKTLQKESP